MSRRDGWGRIREIVPLTWEENVVDSKGKTKDMAKKGTPLKKRGPKKPTGGKQTTGKKKGK